MQERPFYRYLIASLALMVLSGCASYQSPYYDASKPHHRPNGFVNPEGASGGKPLSQLLKWRWEAWKNGDPKPPSTRIQGYDGFEVLTPDLDFLRSNRTVPSITWIGHATVLLQLGGLNILTDPHFTKRASPVSWAGPKRRVRLPVALTELPHIDLVVISHNHYDHLDVGTINMLNAQVGGPPRFLVPLGIERWLEKTGVTTAHAMDWWDETAVKTASTQGEQNGIRAWFVPAQHWSARGLSDRNETLWGGWVLEDTHGFRVFFAGDTGYGNHFKQIGDRFGPIDLSLMPVGAYEPRWFMREQHVNPDEAVLAHRDVRAKHSVGIHWGTFELTDEALDQPIIDLENALEKYRVSTRAFELLRHGETLRFGQ